MNRSQAGRLGALAQQAKHDVRETTKAARAAFTKQFEDELDPGRALPPEELARRVKAAKSAYFSRLAYARFGASSGRRARSGGARP